MFILIKDSYCHSGCYLFVSSITLLKFWLLSKVLATLCLYNSCILSMASDDHLTLKPESKTCQSNCMSDRCIFLRGGRYLVIHIQDFFFKFAWILENWAQIVLLISLHITTLWKDLRPRHCVLNSYKTCLLESYGL